MKSIVKLMYILFVAIVMSGCANKKEKAITAREYYINKGYDVIYPPTLSCFDVDDDYYNT